MKALKPTLLLLALSTMLLTGMKCKKDNQHPTKEQLPAITQTGANTFGFLLNGEVYLPTKSFFHPDFDLSYDPTYNGGALSIVANKLLGDNDRSYLSLGGAGINKIGKYEFTSERKSVNFDSDKFGCEYHYSTTTITGFLNITKLDLVNKIISGTFEFKLEKSGCPTINATQGRFDMKIE